MEVGRGVAAVCGQSETFLAERCFGSLEKIILSKNIKII